MNIETKLEEIVEQNRILIDYIISNHKKRSELRKVYVNLKAGELTNEALERHAAVLGGLPSIERLKAYSDRFIDDTVYSKGEIAECFEWDMAQTSAFVFFAEASRLLESRKGGYAKAICKRSFQNEPFQDMPWKPKTKISEAEDDRNWVL